jgi:hypothetical protein
MKEKGKQCTTSVSPMLPSGEPTLVAQHPMAQATAGSSHTQIISGPPTMAIKSEKSQVAFMDVDPDVHIPETRSQHKG